MSQNYINRTNSTQITSYLVTIGLNLTQKIKILKEDIFWIIFRIHKEKKSVNITNLKEVLDTADIPEKVPVKADKGYQSKKNNILLKNRKLENHILKKATKNKPLTKEDINFNKEISKGRFAVERTFGSIKRWFKGGVARYRGLNKMHTQNIMEAIGYNLYRSPVIFNKLHALSQG